MSTRSAIAYTYGDGWRGRYVHSDGYPTSRGADVYAYLQAKGFDAYRDLIDTHAAGFSWMPTPAEDPHGGIAPVTGEVGMIDAIVSAAVAAGARNTTPSRNGACYASWGREGETDEDDPKDYIEEQGICGPSCDPLFIEWVYVADANGALTIFEGRKAAEGEVTNDSSGYLHRIAWTGRWDGPEPDWTKIEEGDEIEHETAAAIVAPVPSEPISYTLWGWE